MSIVLHCDYLVQDYKLTCDTSSPTLLLICFFKSIKEVPSCRTIPIESVGFRPDIDNIIRLLFSILKARKKDENPLFK